MVNWTDLMNFDKLYSKLPDFIKYNRFVLNFVLKIPKWLSKFNKKDAMFNSQKELFELIFLHSNFEVTGTIKNIQLLYIELVRFIDNVCNKYDIDYWLDCGTLLGAVRHGGFIPWDDDIDLAIMRKDYEKLIEVLPKEIAKHDYLKQECGLTLLRENHENIFKDFNSVYDFDDPEGLLDEVRFLFLQFAWLKPYIKIDFFPKDYIIDEKLEYFKKNYVVTKYQFNKDVQSGKSFDDEFKLKCEKLGLTRDKTGYINDSMDSVDLSAPCIFETDKIFPLTTINFEGYDLKCPNDADHCLKGLFGSNYMRLPDVIEKHNIDTFIKTQFDSEKEMNDKFQKDIKYLRNINDNFE